MLPPGELDGDETSSTRHGLARSLQSPSSSQTSSPVRLEQHPGLTHRVHASNQFARWQHGNEDTARMQQSCPRLSDDDVSGQLRSVTPLSRRQREYEAGLKMFGPDHHNHIPPQHSTTSPDQQPPAAHRYHGTTHTMQYSYTNNKLIK